LDPIGDGRFGAKDDCREREDLGVPGMSPRRDVVDDFLPNAGEEVRCKLIVLELRRKASGGRPGEESVCRGSGRNLDELEFGERGAFVEALSERFFSECVRSFASWDVDCRAARRGVPSLEPDEPSGDGLCMLAVRRPPCGVCCFCADTYVVFSLVLWFKEKKSGDDAGSSQGLRDQNQA
jgi:hypothetical protein